jgi:glyoxylase I family protein
VKLEQIHHVAICVTDLDAALAFYTDVLGLEVVDRPETLPNPGAWLALGDQQVHLLAGDDRPPTTFQHFSVAVPDLVAAADELRELGVALEGHQVVDGYGLQAFLFDPAGNRIELYQQTWPVPARTLAAFLADGSAR